MAGNRGSSGWPTDGAWADDSGNARRNTLGLDVKGVRALSDKIDAAGGGGNAGSLKREFVRWPFLRDRVPVLVEQPGGSHLALRLCCRNLSRGGMSFFHNAYLHEGSRCLIRLPRPTQGDLDVPGVIARCKHRGGVVHEIGVKFDSRIDAKQIVSLGSDAEFFSLEKVDAANLTGSVLLVEPQAADQKLFTHFMKQTGVKVRMVATMKEALDSLKEPADLIISNLQLGEDSAGDLLYQARAAGIHTPMIVLTADVSTDAKTEAGGLGCDGILSKPLTYDRVVRAIAEFLGGAAEATADATRSQLKPDDPSANMLPWFIEELRRIAGEIREAIDKDDSPKCVSLCTTLKGAAPTMGFNAMGASAERALQMLAWTKSPKESAAVLKDVVNACERARAA